MEHTKRTAVHRTAVLFAYSQYPHTAHDDGACQRRHLLWRLLGAALQPFQRQRQVPGHDKMAEV